MIGKRGLRGSGISMLAARHDDNDRLKIKEGKKNDTYILPAKKNYGT